jgi:hypothetical protein
MRPRRRLPLKCRYRPAGQDFYFPRPIAELAPFEINAGTAEETAFVSSSFRGNESPRLISRTAGWVANDQRIVEVYGDKSGFLLKVEDCGEFFITRHGEAIGRSGFQPDSLSQLDREILLGPVIVLALALRNVWSLHASAAMFNENVIAFLGESGMGKSTLSAYLSKQTGWQRVADDILPVKYENGLQALPHFPQLKLPPDQQPANGLPEHLPLNALCLLEHAAADAMPELQKMNIAQTVQALLAHVAGTRLCSAELLAKHLEFSTQAAKQVTAYKLKYPHRREALPIIKELLEKIC